MSEPQKLTTETIIAIISAIAAIISAIVAYTSYIVARKSLKLSVKQYNENQSNFDLYYNEGFRFIAKSGKETKRLLLFHITLRNKSKFRNTFKADLEIEYLRADDSVNRLTIEHNPELQKFLKEKNLTIFPKDIELEANATSTKWVIFEQPILFDSTYRIEKYGLRLLDLSDNKSTIETVLIKDIEE